MTDPRLEPVLLAAASRIQSAAQAAAAQVVEMLGLASMSATSNAQRQAFTAAQFDLRHKMVAFNQTFSRVLYEKVTGDLRKTPNDSGSGGQTDWQSLTLVDESEMEGQVLADRVATDMAQECEWELRELSGYVLPMLDEDHAARTDVERNPLRPRNIGRALYQAVQATSQEADVRKLLAKEIGRTLGQSLRGCYQAVIEDLRQRGVQPAGLAARPSAAGGLGRGAPGAVPESPPKAGTPPAGPRSEVQMARTLGAMFGVNVPANFSTSAAGLDGAPTAAGGFAPTGAGGGPGGGGGGGYGGGPTGAAADAAMLDVIKRLAFLSAQGGGDAGGWSASAPGGFASSGGTGADGGMGGAATGMGGLGGLMAVNLIRAHREELMRATGAPLDHMVIDVVAALFDQVLSDPKVPPQIARLIARLQLPVLRVALKDMNFFSSRKHPVRRFVNRIASLAASFDDFDEGPGQECLRRVADLVGEIVEGDFDQMANYEAKLGELEAFIREQTAQVAEEHAEASAVLVGKEADLRIQQRYMRALQTQLSSLDVDDFLRDFLSQVWSQVQVLAQAREGADSPFVERVRRVPRELILSVQPKGTPQLRKDFLVRLPQLMKDLNDGLTLIRWPEDAKKEFFSRLLPSHAASLKVAPPTDFARRQLDFQLDQIDKVSIPSRDEVAGEATAPVMLGEADAVADLSPQEAAAVGLVDEQSIDWSGEIDIDLGEPVVNTADVDINLDTPPQPSAGPQLINHIQPGVAYQMYLNDSWKKVRLSWVSPGRTFFIFTYGRMYKQTISLTGRTLVKMCEGNRFRAYEQAELIERATARARKQLAALSASVATKQ